MTVSKTPVNKHDIVSNIHLSVEVYQVSLASVKRCFSSHKIPARKPQRISSMASTLLLDSPDLMSVIVKPTHEKSRSDCAEIHTTSQYSYSTSHVVYLVGFGRGLEKFPIILTHFWSTQPWTSLLHLANSWASALHNLEGDVVYLKKTYTKKRHTHTEVKNKKYIKIRLKILKWTTIPLHDNELWAQNLTLALCKTVQKKTR